MKNYKKRFISLLVLVVVFSSVLVGCGSGEVSTDGTANEDAQTKIVAEYKDGKITQSEFDTYVSIIKFFQPSIEESLNVLDEDTKKQALNTYLELYVGEKYLDAKAEKVENADELINEQFKAIKESSITTLGSEEKYQEKLKSLNITEDDLKDYIGRNYRLNNYFIEKAYSETPEEFTVASVRHILINIGEDTENEDGTIKKGRTEEEAAKIANEVLAKINEGEEFAELAGQYSEDPGSKDNGGLYENYPIAGFVTEFKEAIKGLEADEVSGLVKTNYGYHIIKLVSKSIPALEEVSDQVKGIILQTEYTKFSQVELKNIGIKTNL